MKKQIFLISNVVAFAFTSASCGGETSSDSNNNPGSDPADSDLDVGATVYTGLIQAADGELVFAECPDGKVLSMEISGTQVMTMQDGSTTELGTSSDVFIAYDGGVATIYATVSSDLTDPISSEVTTSYSCNEETTFDYLEQQELGDYLSSNDYEVSYRVLNVTGTGDSITEPQGSFTTVATVRYLSPDSSILEIASTSKVEYTISDLTHTTDLN